MDQQEHAVHVPVADASYFFGYRADRTAFRIRQRDPEQPGPAELGVFARYRDATDACGRDERI
jgi:hypothetical protein